MTTFLIFSTITLEILYNFSKFRYFICYIIFSEIENQQKLL